MIFGRYSDLVHVWAVRVAIVAQGLSGSDVQRDSVGRGVLGMLHWVLVLCFGSLACMHRRVLLYLGSMPLPVRCPMKRVCLLGSGGNWLYVGTKVGILG